MKLISWNVNGIRSVLRKDALLPFVKAADPDILCLQETKAQVGEATVDLPEYQEHWYSAAKKGYSGTALFTKKKPLAVVNGLPADIVARFDLPEDGYGDPHDEGRVIAAEYAAFFLVTVYTPNAKEDLSRLPLRAKHWDPAFLAYCLQLEKKKPVIFCGDLNVAHTELDLANPKANKGKKGFTDEERAGFQAFLDAGFVDTLRLFKQGNGLYTWWSNFGGARERNVGWRIDYFLVSGSLRGKVSGAEILPMVMGSDHCPVSLTLDL
jgi:exodeoxyribonuclease-3